MNPDFDTEDSMELEPTTDDEDLEPPATLAAVNPETEQRDQQMLRSMLRAREFVVWLGMTWLLIGIALLVAGLLLESQASDSSSPHASTRPSEETALAEDRGSMMTRAVGALSEAIREPSLDERVSGEWWVVRVGAVAVIVSGLILLWAVTEVFFCARHFGGLSYAAGHTALVILLTPVLLLGPVWLPLLVADDIRTGRAARVRSRPTPRKLDFLAVGLVVAGVAAGIWYFALQV